MGLRPDRHRHKCLAYKVWVTEHGVETALYRHDAEAANVDRFLWLVRKTAKEHLGAKPDGYRNTGGELIVDFDVMDIVGRPGGTDLESGLGMGRWGTGPFLRLSELSEAIIEDVGRRLAASA